MEITLMGYLLIPTGLLLLLLNKVYLLYALVFFSGFTGSSVLNFDIIDYSLQPAYYFGILLIIKYIIEIFLRNTSLIMPNKYLLLFVVICTVSLIMPLLLETRNVEVLNPDNIYSEVSLNMQNITQYLYLIFCFIIYWLVRDYIRNDINKVYQVLRIFLYSAVVISLLGFYQEIAYVMNWPYDELFRSSFNINVQPYGSFVRVYAVAAEPSMYAVFLAPLIALTLFVEKTNFKYKWGLLILLVVSGILSTSTSFVLGMSIFITMLILDKLFKYNYNKDDIRIIKSFSIITVIVSIFTLLAFTFIPQVKRLLTTDIFDKLNGVSVSGSERIGAMLHHFFVSLEYPLLGVGFGSARSKDLLSSLLVNIGYIGTGILILYIISTSYKLLRIKDNNIKLVSRGYSYYLIILFLILLISVAELYFLFIWIAFAVSESLIHVNNTACKPNMVNDQGSQKGNS